MRGKLSPAPHQTNLRRCATLCYCRLPMPIDMEWSTRGSLLQGMPTRQALRATIPSIEDDTGPATWAVATSTSAARGGQHGYIR